MKPPRDLSRAVRGYQAFTEFEPREIGTFRGLVIPTKLCRVGRAIHVCYRSDKWEAKVHDYIHEHDAGTHVYLPDGADGPLVPVPESVRRATALYLIGPCAELEFDGPGGLRITRPYPELYATSDSRHLLVIEVAGRRARVAAAIWGRNLVVRPEGIVG